MSKYVVYKHTSPNGKVYIGITRRNVSECWGKDGIGYKDNEHFYRAIQKYGWDNIKHEILFTELSKDEACELEIKLIKELKSNDYNFGYNICAGGEGRLDNPQSVETKRKISMTVKEQWNDPIIRQHHIDGAKGRKVSQETRDKIRNSQIGKYVPPEVGKKISDSKKGKHPWNYGKKCKPRSDETKAKISDTLKKQNAERRKQNENL